MHTRPPVPVPVPPGTEAVAVTARDTDHGEPANSRDSGGATPAGTQPRPGTAGARPPRLPHGSPSGTGTELPAATGGRDLVPNRERCTRHQ